MNNVIIMLAGFALLSIIFIFMLAISRFLAIKAGAHLRDVTPSGEKLSPFAHRVHRAHANYYENLPLLLCIVFIAFLLGKIDMLNSLALYVLGFRIIQSLSHVISTKVPFLMIRVSSFTVQVGIMLYWLIIITRSI